LIVSIFEEEEEVVKMISRTIVLWRNKSIILQGRMKMMLFLFHEKSTHVNEYGRILLATLVFVLSWH